MNLPDELFLCCFYLNTGAHVSLQDHSIICSQDHRIMCTQDHPPAGSQDHLHADHWMMWLQVWRVAHPPVRGHHWKFTRPLVHVGFLKSWLAGGLNDKVVGRIMQLVNARPAGSHAKPLKIYVTGTPTPAQQRGPCPATALTVFTHMQTVKLCELLSSISYPKQRIVSTMYSTLHSLDLLTGSSSNRSRNPSCFTSTALML